MAGHVYVSYSRGDAQQERVRRPAQRRWIAPASGVAMLLLFFVGTFLIIRSLDGDRTDPGVAVGSCVIKDADGRLAAAKCGSPGAHTITQIPPAGRPCDNPADFQHFFTTAGRPSICVRAVE